jgi:broad-specificity NMP kinase
MHSNNNNRTKPNILITGTPGTGKTTLSQNLAQSVGMNHIEVGQIVKEKGLHDGWDEEFQSYLLNEDKVSKITNKELIATGLRRIRRYYGKRKQHCRSSWLRFFS